jgi:hypothetical protein
MNKIEIFLRNLYLRFKSFFSKDPNVVFSFSIKVKFYCNPIQYFKLRELRKIYKNKEFIQTENAMKIEALTLFEENKDLFKKLNVDIKL